MSQLVGEPSLVVHGLQCHSLLAGRVSSVPVPLLVNSVVPRGIRAHLLQDAIPTQNRYQKMDEALLSSEHLIMTQQTSPIRCPLALREPASASGVQRIT